MRKASLLLWSIALGCEPLPYQSPSQTEQAPPTPSAFLHVVVGSSAVPTLSLQLGDLPNVELARHEVSPRLSLPSGEYPLSLSGSGQRLYSSSLRLLPESETLLVAHQGVDSGGLWTSLRLTPLHLGKRDSQHARLRLGHFCEGAPLLSLVSPGGDVLVDGVGSGFVSAYADLGQPLAMASSLQLRSARQSAPLWDVTLPAGLPLSSATALLAVGDPSPLGSEPFSLLAFDEESGRVTALPVRPATGAADGQIYLVHAASSVSEVTAKSGQGPLFSRIGYQQASPLGALHAGTTELALDLAAQTLWRGSLRMWPGKSWLLLLYGTQTMPKLLVLPRPERAPQTVWRVANVIEGLGSADLLDGDDAVVNRLGYGSASEPQLGTLPRRTLRLRSRDSGQASWDISLDQAAQAAAQDQVVTILLTGTVSDKSKVAALMIVESRASAAMAAPVVALPTVPSL
uniref:Lipoprotein n=1 Tax=uncultured bacterium A1Q1_fos_565 TaxID=1256585 RepID=L7W1Z3_9BACT|nr:hypothetical protein [uncultured bacterium A1Q1_fos_565]